MIREAMPPQPAVETTMQKPRVIIADDHRLIVAALKELLASECDIVNTVYDGETLLVEVRRLRPEIILLDISMPPSGGLDIIYRLQQVDQSMRIIVVTMSEDPDIAAEALRLGASAYVLKSSAPSELLEAIRHVINQHVYVTPCVASGIIDSLTKPVQSHTSNHLSRRQRDVLRLLAEGKSMKEAAAALNLAVTTVSFHKYRMMKQLNIKTSAELIRFAVAQHII
jgi:DNA-binding NarL/FixJ family response regulator